MMRDPPRAATRDARREMRCLTSNNLRTDLNEYLQYCWLAHSHEDFRLAPFHLLARTASFGFAGDAARGWGAAHRGLFAVLGIAEHFDVMDLRCINAELKSVRKPRMRKFHQSY
jgi:hypothetical protein